MHLSDNPDVPVRAVIFRYRGCARGKTAILSNSFVGAREREREQAAHGFHEMCDVIVYSHEVGCLKPEAKMALTGLVTAGSHSPRVRLRPSATRNSSSTAPDTASIAARIVWSPTTWMTSG